MNLNANTITDEQIRELRDSMSDDDPSRFAVWEDCAISLKRPGQRLFDRVVTSQDRGAARARCAEILNARGGK